jgi:hypothetical protein
MDFEKKNRLGNFFSVGSNIFEIIWEKKSWIFKLQKLWMKKKRNHVSIFLALF